VSGTVTRWERERAAWVMARSKPGRSSRRRAELLGRRARRLSRGGTGVAESSLHEDVTPPLFRRLLASDEGATEQLLRMLGVPMLYGLAGLLVGPAVAIAAGLYFLRWYRAPKTGRLRAWPWPVAGGISLVLGAVIQSVIDAGPGAWFTPWPLALHVYLPILVPTWLWVQTTLGLLLTGWLVWANGWAAVPKNAVPKPEKDKHGEFIKTPDKDKAQLNPYVGEKSTPRTKRTQPLAPPKLTLESLAPEPDELDSDIGEELPVFPDEDAGLDDELIFEDDPAGTPR